MFEQNFRNSYKKYFLAHTVSKLAQFTAFASVNIPSKRELLIMSAKFLPFSCASIHKSSLVEPKCSIHLQFSYLQRSASFVCHIISLNLLFTPFINFQNLLGKTFNNSFKNFELFTQSKYLTNQVCMSTGSVMRIYLKINQIYKV